MTRINLNKKNVLHMVRNIMFLSLGSFLIAFGDMVFLVPFNIANGGVYSIALIVQKLVGPSQNVIDIVTWIVQVVLFIVGFLVLGKRFSFHTLFSSLVYPIFLTLLYRISVNGQTLGQWMYGQLNFPNSAMTGTVLAGIFGGAIIGMGVAFTFIGDGSSGGLDILCFIIEKYTSIKKSVSTFFIDASIIIVAMIVFYATGVEHAIALSLIAIISAFICAFSINIISQASNNFVIADIITEHPEEIQSYVHEKMDRGTTVIEVKGGYTGENRIMIRVAFNRIELTGLKDFIAITDPDAFVTYTQASAINGEGFIPFVPRSKRKVKEKKKDGE